MPAVPLFAILASIAALDPCQDAAYLDLRTKTLAQMSEVERTYFLEKDKFCMEEVRKASAAASTGMAAPAAQPEPSPAPKSLDHRKPSREPASISLGAVGGFMAGLGALILAIRLVTL